MHVFEWLDGWMSKDIISSKWMFIYNQTAGNLRIPDSQNHTLCFFNYIPGNLGNYEIISAPADPSSAKQQSNYWLLNETIFICLHFGIYQWDLELITFAYIRIGHQVPSFIKKSPIYTEQSKSIRTICSFIVTPWHVLLCCHLCLLIRNSRGWTLVVTCQLGWLVIKR